MDGRTDPLNDAALEQEIEALLSVQPSPDFAARVRSRVAEEPVSSGWGWRWRIAAVTTAVVLTSIAVAWRSQSSMPSVDSSSNRSEGRTIVRAPVTPPARGARAAVPERQNQLAQSRQVTSRSRAARSDRRPSEATHDAEGVDEEAFDRLLATIRRPDVVFDLNSNPPGPPWLETSTITIDPIVIKPVPPIEQLEGGEE
jgi:hypothetical protein